MEARPGNVPETRLRGENGTPCEPASGVQAGAGGNVSTLHARATSRTRYARSQSGIFADLVLGDVGLERTCIRQFVQGILNRMVQYTKARLDLSFAALSDATRRGVLEQLGDADASITDLAEAFHMTLTGMRKHVGVLEQAELVTTEKVGRVRTCTLGPRRLEEETAWIERYGQVWDSRFEELDKIVEELRWKEKVDGRKKRK
jgi:DNA-binding transcriptional ArsR family regulator